jgi:hypothetical protein
MFRFHRGMEWKFSLSGHRTRSAARQVQTPVCNETDTVIRREVEHDGSALAGSRKSGVVCISTVTIPAFIRAMGSGRIVGTMSAEFFVPFRSTLSLPAFAARLLGFVAGVGMLPLATAQVGFVPVTLSFNDLGPAPGGVHMPATHRGFQWGSGDWHFMSLASTPAETFLALSGNATGIRRSNGDDFYFEGAEFWSRRGADANGRFYFYLLRDGAVVYDGRDDPDGRQRFDATHQTFTANYAGPVDYVAVVFDAGGDDWDHLAMDNLRVRTLQPPEVDVPQNVGIVREGDGKIRAMWRGTPGATYRVEVSPDLIGWDPAATVEAAADSGLFEFVDSPALTAAPRFYRGARP